LKGISLILALFFGIALFAYARDTEKKPVSASPEEMSEKESYRYKHGGRRDPFVPLIGAKTKAGGALEDVMSIEDVKFQGVAIDSRGLKTVILNDEPVNEGETVGHVTVKKILKDKVILLIDKEKYEIDFVEEEGGANE